MAQIINTDFKVGILGGGQLGKMLGQAASPWDLTTWILDMDSSYPAGKTCTHFVEGNFKQYEAVYDFGRQVDVLTIEIEHVDTDALLDLEREGKTIHPRPAALNIIKDKGLQKLFYEEKNIPTSPFRLFESGESIRAALGEDKLSYPFVQKTRTAGYDGRGVAVIRTEGDLHKLMEAPSLIEDLVPIDKEIAVIVARNPSGEVSAFPPVEMEFNPEANLVEYLLCPARVSEAIQQQAMQMAREVIEAFDICGLLAVELFLNKEGELLVNEVAPRPHNSGHHTIESCYTSQFEQHLRAILDLPLGSTRMKTAAVMVNLLGEPGHQGPAKYQGLEEILKIEGVKPHIYGKEVTKPFRKMGHVTVLDQDLDKALDKAHQVKDLLKVIA